MTARQWTAIGLGVSALVLGAVELNALANEREGDTISEIIADTAKAQPLTLIAVGACASHFAGGVHSLQRLASQYPLLPLGAGIAIGLMWPLKGLKT